MKSFLKRNKPTISAFFIFIITVVAVNFAPTGSDSLNFANASIFSSNTNKIGFEVFILICAIVIFLINSIKNYKERKSKNEKTKINNKKV